MEVKKVPKYEEIANILRERIQNGEYPADSFMPNQVDLVDEFGVSRMTIKKAINILTMEGLVYSQRGSGTKILNHPFLKDKNLSYLKDYQGLSNDFENTNHDLVSEPIQFTVEFPDEVIQERLMVSDSQPVYNILRLRILDGEPFILEHTYMPVDLVPGLTKNHICHSIYSYLKKELGIKFAGAYRTISADKSSAYDEKYLNCGEHDPILEIKQVIYQKDGRPIEFSRSRNRFDVRAYSYLDIQV